MQWDFAMDAGSENMRFATRERPDQFHESSFVALRTPRLAPIAWGDRAYMYLGRTREGMRLSRPVTGGVPTDTRLLGLWAEKLFKSVPQRALKRPKLLLGAFPGSITEYNRRAQRALIDAGADAVGLVRTDIASALGAGLEPMEPEALMVVDAGAETITASLISGGRVVRCETLPFGMSRIDEYLSRALSVDLGCTFGPVSVREIKHELAAASGASGRVRTEKPGFDFTDMLPRMREIRAEAVASSVEGVVHEICALCARIVYFAPEEIAADLTKRGVLLTGGGANLFGLDERVRDATGLSTTPAQDPEYCAILGLHKILCEPDKYAPFVTDIMEGARRV